VTLASSRSSSKATSSGCAALDDELLVLEEVLLLEELSTLELLELLEALETLEELDELDELSELWMDEELLLDEDDDEAGERVQPARAEAPKSRMVRNERNERFRTRHPSLWV